MAKLLLFAIVLYVLYRFAVRAMRRPPAMPRTEAAKLLGLSSDADAAAVLDAHRRLIARVHPDAGGSAELAARINEARDTLLRP